MTLFSSIIITEIYKNVNYGQTEEMAAEGELRSHSVDDSERVRELQDKVADLQAEVSCKHSLQRRWELICVI